MAFIHQGIQSTLVAIDIADISNADTANIYMDSRPRTFTFNSTSTEATKVVRPGPFYLRPHDYATAGVWVETIGNDLDVFNAEQIITGLLTSTNWAAAAGSQFDLDAGTLEIRESGGGILIKQGGDIVLEGGSAGDPSLITLEAAEASGAGNSQIQFAKDADEYISMKMYRYGAPPYVYVLTLGPTETFRDNTTYVSMAIGNVYCGYVSFAATISHSFWTGDFGSSAKMMEIHESNGISFWTNGVGIGIDTYLGDADLTCEGGLLCIKETTTPTARTDYGKIYCKSDNKLYFQDGGGTEHELAFA